MRGWIWLLALGIAACDGAGNGEGDTDDDTDTTGPDGPGLDGLPDLFATLAGRTHACEDQPLYNPDVPTATTYWIGEFTFDSEGVVFGTETWVQYANPRWIEVGGHDCQIVWSVGGYKDERVNRGHYSLHLQGTVDLSKTDCPTDAAGTTIYEGTETFTVVYDVTTLEDGTAEFHFAATGTALATGYHNANAVNYITGMKCNLY